MLTDALGCAGAEDYTAQITSAELASEKATIMLSAMEHLSEGEAELLDRLKQIKGKSAQIWKMGDGAGPS